MLAASPEVIHNELETCVAILKKWQGLAQQIPGVHVPVSGAHGPQALENFLREFVGELQIVAGKCDTLADVLASGVR